MGWRDDYDYDDIKLDRHEHGPKSQSGIGITSLLISVVVGALLVVLIVVATLIAVGQNGQVNDQDPLAVVVGLGILFGLGGALVGLVLGVVGSLQSDRKILCAVLGAIFNTLILVGVIGLICTGVMLGG
jgi:hypothetical protein